jgi:dTDP-4-amino-4,6-dideoxygalactose transaminase
MILCANPSAQFESYQTEIEEAVLKVMRGNRFILGDEVEALEQEFASYIKTSEAVGVANGTDAIELALRALDIGAGDEVITVSHTAVATVAAIESTGAIPILVDVEPKFYTLNALQLEEVITPKTKAIIAVHLYGQPADLDSIALLCKAHKLYLIEDCAQAHGAQYKGKRVGSIGDVGCFSCYPTKNLGAIGDAGLITTNDTGLAMKIRKLREYGWNRRSSEYAGRNSRLDEIQAAVLRVKLKHLDADNNKRRFLASCYNEQLFGLAIQLPNIRCEVESVYHLFVIQVEEQHKLIEHLLNQGIQAGIHYPIPVHLQPAYKNRISTAKNMNITESLATTIVSLPMYPELSNENVVKICNAVKYFVKRSDGP